jgi:antitoxin MazE
MNGHFSKWGNSIALRIPHGVAKELQVTEGSMAELQVKDGSLVVTPVTIVPRYDIDELVAAITPENVHGETGTGGAVGNEIG